MLDFSQWLADAITFLRRMQTLPGDIRIEGSVMPPHDAPEIALLQAKSRLPIPETLGRFWREGTRQSDLSYCWDTPARFHNQLAAAFPRYSRSWVWGGASFLSAEESCGLTHDFVSWADAFGECFPRDARLWRHSFPLIPDGGGDYIGLYVRDAPDNPPVVYLCHDGCGASCEIAPNLEVFLSRWAEIGYVGVDLLLTFCDPTKRTLNPAAFPLEREALVETLAGNVRPDIVKRSLNMSPTEWAESDNPAAMLAWLEHQGRLNSTNLRLYCCACCRRVWDALRPLARRAVETAERFAQGQATEQELSEARAMLAGEPAANASEQATLGSSADFVTRLLTTFQGDLGKMITDPGFLTSNKQYMDAMQKTVVFEESQGPMHRIAYSAIDADSSISSEITQHLEEPAATTERLAHADLIRAIFGDSA